jgi:hypothetical protein
MIEGAAPTAAQATTVEIPSRLMKRASGKSVQGYHAQVVASPEQVLIAADVTQSHNDADQLEPMVAQVAETLREVGIDEPVRIVLADGGYWNSPAVSEVRRQGTNVIVPTQNRRRTAPRKLSPRQGKEAQRIEAIMSTPEGRALYRRRQQIVEPVFAQSSLSVPATESVENGPKWQISHLPQKRLHRHCSPARQLKRSAVQPPVRDLIDTQCVCLARLVAHPEGDHSEPDRALGVADRNHHGTEASRRPWDVRLDAAAEPRTVATFRFAGQEPLTG